MRFAGILLEFATSNHSPRANGGNDQAHSRRDCCNSGSIFRNGLFLGSLDQCTDANRNSLSEHIGQPDVAERCSVNHMLAALRRRPE